MLTGQKEGGICRIAMNVDHVELNSSGSSSQCIEYKLRSGQRRHLVNIVSTFFGSKNFGPEMFLREKFTGESCSSVQQSFFLTC